MSEPLPGAPEGGGSLRPADGTARRPRRTPLHARHVALGGRMVEFAGFEMPLQYSGILDEHRAVREAAGVFDVSHMGELWLEGERAMAVGQRLFTSDLARLADGRALYTVMCREGGGIVDDCVVYRVAQDRWLVIVNASNIGKDREHIEETAAGACAVVDRSDETALIAVQGPFAIAIVAGLCDRPIADLPRFAFSDAAVAGAPATVSRTGYTGEDGVEILCGADRAGALWDALLDAGRPRGVKPAGLGARDTLRLEARLCLYGQDLDETTSPLQAGLGWVVHMDKGDFCGRDALAREKAQGPHRKLVGLVMRGRGIARHGMALLAAGPDGAPGERAGEVTSGAPSPSTGRNVALGYLRADLAAPGTRVLVDVRGKPVEAEVVKGPFYQRV